MTGPGSRRTGSVSTAADSETRVYELLVCPLCRARLRFYDNDEGMFSRAECCGRVWFYPQDAYRPEDAALLIETVELR